MESATEQNIRYQQQVIDWSIVLVAVSFAVSIARFVARWKGGAERNKFQWVAWDDALVLPGLCAIIIVGTTWSSK